MEKKCYRCKQDVPADVAHFTRNVSKPGGFDHICKACRKKARVDRKLEKKKEAHLQEVYALSFLFLSKVVAEEFGMPEVVKEALVKAEEFLAAGQK